jgi:hypothetical protein
MVALTPANLGGENATHFFGRLLFNSITPKVGLGTSLRTLDDCARFLGSLHGWRQAGAPLGVCGRIDPGVGPDGARTLTPLRS